MSYPLISEYIESIKYAEENFATLTNLRPVLDDEGNPIMSSGNFAVVFKMKDERNGKSYALKCFIKDQEGRNEAYKHIANELEFVSSEFIIPIKFFEKELFVATSNSDETEFPVLLMDWVEGVTLDKYVRAHLQDQYSLQLISYQFCRVAAWLMAQPFAHGDLKPDNILVKDDGSLVLVDYDGMFVPAMKGQKAREIGSPDYRHPARTIDDFNESIDDFSLATIAMQLYAIALQPELLTTTSGDTLLLCEKDYRYLEKSKTMTKLFSQIGSPEFEKLLAIFLLVHSDNTLSKVSFRIFNISKPTKPNACTHLSTNVTKEDLANGVEDEYGVLYSPDGLRLLSAPKDLVYYIIKEGTQVICDLAFVNIDVEDVDYQHNIDSGQTVWDFIRNTSKLKAISIPNSVTRIGNDVFGYCDKLKTIVIPTGTRTKFEEFLHEWRKELKETSNNLNPETFVYLLIERYANNLLLCFEDEDYNEVRKKVLLNELKILSAASILDVNKQENDNVSTFIEKKILDDFLSVKEVDNYDNWIESNTPGMCLGYSYYPYYTDGEAISLSEFEKDNGQIKFYKGKINAYPYDDSFWGEFVDKNGKKQIIYVDIGFPSEYMKDELIKNNSLFGIVEEKDTYYHTNKIDYCLKIITQKHSMLPSYINERLFFYSKVIKEAISDLQRIKVFSFLLFNAVTNEIFRLYIQYLEVDDLLFLDNEVVYDQTGEHFPFNPTSLDRFTKYFWNSLM